VRSLSLPWEKPRDSLVRGEESSRSDIGAKRRKNGESSYRLRREARSFGQDQAKRAGEGCPVASSARLGRVPA